MMFEELSWDRDSVIDRITREYIEDLPKPVSFPNEDLKNGLTNAIIDSINERNLMQAGPNIATIQSLPNRCIAEVIFAKYDVRYIQEKNAVGICMAEQTEYETFDDCIISIFFFNRLVRSFKFNASTRDVSEVVNILYDKCL